MNEKRADRVGENRNAYRKNCEKIKQTQDVCGICGKPVDKTLKYPHPLSATVDHIIPIVKGGHPSDIENLQLAHWTCNRQKSDKLLRSKDDGVMPAEDAISNRILPLAADWANLKR